MRGDKQKAPFRQTSAVAASASSNRTYDWLPALWLVISKLPQIWYLPRLYLLSTTTRLGLPMSPHENRSPLQRLLFEETRVYTTCNRRRGCKSNAQKPWRDGLYSNYSAKKIDRISPDIGNAPFDSSRLCSYQNSGNGGDLRPYRCSCLISLRRYSSCCDVMGCRSTVSLSSCIFNIVNGYDCARIYGVEMEWHVEKC